MNNELRIKALNNAGNEVNYFSLNLPTDFMNGEVVSLELQLMKNNYFAKNSGFYGKLMSDGNIFNPYLHRRFLPAKFLKMFFSKQGFNDCLDKDYSFDYSIKTTISEIKKLAFLESADKVAFDERSKFFTLAIVKKILIEYANGVCTIAKQRMKNTKNSWTYTSSQNTLNKYNGLIARIDATTSYEQLDRVIGTTGYFERLKNNTKKCSEFKSAYKSAGAYYTMKHLIMFEGCNFSNYSELNSLKELRNILVTKEQYTFSAILKNLVEVNCYSIVK